MTGVNAVRTATLVVNSSSSQFDNILLVRKLDTNAM